MTSTVLALRDLSRRFGATEALRNVSFEIHAGEVVALLGANGAGKSTLIKLLGGVFRPSSGEIHVEGSSFSHGLGPGDVNSHGMAFVHQDLGLFEHVSVAENIGYVTGFAKRRGLISWRRQQRLAAKILDRWGLDVDPSARVGDLERAQRALVAIARAMATEARLVVFDEPTVSLSRHDAEAVYRAVERLRDGGVAVLYVTHQLHEVDRLADRIVVLRDGQVADSLRAGDVSHERLVSLIVAGAHDDEVAEAPAPSSDTVLQWRRLGSAGTRSLHLRRGEIVAAVGLVGGGQRALARAIAGVDASPEVEMFLDGTRYAPASPRDAQADGVMYLPADRLTEGSFPALPSVSNLTIKHGGDRRLIRHRAERLWASELLRRFGVVPAEPGAVFRTLSGGNQQKLLLAKWLETNPRVLVADEPFSGVDVGARAFLRSRLVAAAGQGVSILLVTSNPEDVTDLAHRAVVFRGGEPTVELRGSGLTVERITEACMADLTLAEATR